MEEVVVGKAEEAADVGALVSLEEGFNALLAPIRPAEGPVAEPLPAPVDDRIGQLVATSSIGAVREDALQIADSSGYRFYTMRARHLCAATGGDEVISARHLRVGDALARSLAANLDRDDGAAFLRMQGVKPRLRRWQGGT